MPKLLGKIGRALAAGVQGGLETYSSLQNLEARKQQTEAALQNAEAYKQQVQASLQKSEEERRFRAFDLFNSEIATIGNITDDKSQKALVKRKFSFINDLATKAGLTPYDSPDDLTSDVAITSQVEAIKRYNLAKNKFAGIQANAVNPKDAGFLFNELSEATQQIKSLNMHDSNAVKRYDEQLEHYSSMYAQYIEKRKPAAVDAATGKVLTTDQAKVVGQLGGSQYAGMTEVGGQALPKVGTKPKEDKTEETTSKAVSKLRTETQRGPLGELAKSRNTVQVTTQTAEKALSNPSAYGDIGLFLQSIKSLQGDNSVAREAEQKLMQQAGSVVIKLENAVKRRLTGESFTPEQRQDIYEVVKGLSEAYNRAYKKAAAPILKTAKREKLPLDEIFDDPFLYADEEPVKEADKKTSPEAGGFKLNF